MTGCSAGARRPASIRKLDREPVWTRSLAVVTDSLPREASQRSRRKLDQRFAVRFPTGGFAVLRDHGPGPYHHLRHGKATGRAMDAAGQQLRHLRAVPLTDRARGVHRSLQDAVDSEAAELKAGKLMSLPVTDRVYACQADHIAFVAADPFRLRKSACTEQTESGTQQRADQTLAHFGLPCVCLELRKLIEDERAAG